LDFSTLKDKHNICTLSVDMNLFEIGLKQVKCSQSLSCFQFLKIVEIHFRFADNVYIVYIYH
jgi:hypothetical protein